MTTRRFCLSLLPMLTASTLLAGCVMQSTYDALNQKYMQLQAAYSADQAEIVMLEGRLKVTIRDQILFPEGGWRITPQAEAVLRKMVPVLSTLTQTKVVVAGYTDTVPIGPELRRDGIMSNIDLSSRRADGVANYLVRAGVPQTLVSAQGFGPDNPVASNDTPEGRAKNRRIEVTLVGPGN
ncbi:MAG: flagellar motor protein MotB [Acetobacteraceae bacterium]